MIRIILKRIFGGAKRERKLTVSRIVNLHACAVFAFSLTSCHKAFESHLEAWDSIDTDHQRQRIVEDAIDLQHHRYFYVDKHYIPKDCSGYIATILYKNGFDVYGGASARNIEGNGVTLVYDFIGRDGGLLQKNPEIGDLIFFNNTYDRNKDGLINDPLTHIGIVTKIDQDQTITFLHFLRKKVRESVMNLSTPHLAQNGTKTVNSYLRRRSRRDPQGSPYLSGELFQAFGSFIKKPEGLSDLTE